MFRLTLIVGLHFHKSVLVPGVLSGPLIINTQKRPVFIFTFDYDPGCTIICVKDLKCALQFIWIVFHMHNWHFISTYNCIQPLPFFPLSASGWWCFNALNMKTMGLSRTVLTWKLPSIPYTHSCMYLPLPLLLCPSPSWMSVLLPTRLPALKFFPSCSFL